MVVSVEEASCQDITSGLRRTRGWMRSRAGTSVLEKTDVSFRFPPLPRLKGDDTNKASNLRITHNWDAFA